MNLIPRRVHRSPEQVRPVLAYRDMDRLRPDGTVEPGNEIVVKQLPGHGWLWLGRVWRWRDW